MVGTRPVDIDNDTSVAKPFLPLSRTVTNNFSHAQGPTRGRAFPDSALVSHSKRRRRKQTTPSLQTDCRRLTCFNTIKTLLAMLLLLLIGECATRHGVKQKEGKNAIDRMACGVSTEHPSFYCVSDQWVRKNMRGQKVENRQPSKTSGWLMYVDFLIGWNMTRRCTLWRNVDQCGVSITTYLSKE